MSLFSTRLKDLLDERGLEQQDLGAIVGVTPQAVSKWLLGLSQPSKGNVNVIADYLQVSLDYLEGRTDVRSILQNTDSTSPTVGEHSLSYNSGSEQKVNNLVNYWKGKFTEAAKDLKSCQEQTTLLKSLVSEKERLILHLQANN